MTHQLSCGIVPSLWVLGMVLTLSSPAQGQAPGSSAGATIYVSADAGSGGNGSQGRPFACCVDILL